MKKKLLVVLLLFFLIQSKGVYAGSCNSGVTPKSLVGDGSGTITITLNDALPSGDFYILFDGSKGLDPRINFSVPPPSRSLYTNSDINVNKTENAVTSSDDRVITLKLFRNNSEYCTLGTYELKSPLTNEYTGPVIGRPEIINANGNTECIDGDTQLTIKGSNYQREFADGRIEGVNLNSPMYISGDSETATLSIRDGSGQIIASTMNINIVNGEFNVTFQGLTPASSSSLKFTHMITSGGWPTTFTDKNYTFYEIKTVCDKDDITIGPGDPGESKGVLKAPKKNECSFNGKEDGMYTALGCVPTSPTGLITWIMKYAISIGGGVAFLLMVFGGFLLSTSSGNPERVKQGQEMLTSAIVGLLFIIFSVFLLQFIGVDILKIPGFTN